MSVTQLVPHDAAVVMAVQKRALDDRSTEQLVDDVHTAAAERTGVPIIIDLAKVKFAPSVALGALVKLAKSFEFDGRRLALVGLDRRVREAIRITSLDQILEVHRTVEDVVGRA